MSKGCVMSPRLCNLFMGGMVRKVNVRVLERKVSQKSVGVGASEVSQMLFTNDKALELDLNEKLQKLVSDSGSVKCGS